VDFLPHICGENSYSGDFSEGLPRTVIMYFLGELNPGGPNFVHFTPPGFSRGKENGHVIKKIMAPGFEHLHKDAGVCDAAHVLGQPPEPYVVTVAMAAVASFLTPIGHHGNLLIYGPGRYQFTDFVWVGPHSPSWSLSSWPK
jgi:hypothetical protein